MSSLPEEKVLRINCPGFGTSTTLPLGEAKPLAMYDVIIINASSVLHMFDDKSDVLKQIETLQTDGMTSYRAEDDSLLESITAELDLRTQELMQFLKKGGLLIYFLAPPFTMHGPSITMDNYSWLGDWAPDKPSGPNQRNMSATIRGKAIELTPEAGNSVWQPYLKQTNLEWSTIIRNENLSEGYVSLATAGPNKCIAGFKQSGPKGGMVVFLPAPFEKGFEEKLKDCLDKWYTTLHNEEAASTSEPAPSGLANLSNSLSSLLTDEEEPVKAAEPTKGKKAEKSALDDLMGEIPAAPAAAEKTPEFFDFDKSENNNNHEPKVAATESNDNPEAKDLIRKMEQEISTKPVVPEWCAKFSFTELDGLRQQLTDLQEEMRLSQLKAADLQNRIEVTEDLKNSLLSSQGEHLTLACTRVFETLGWNVKPALGSPEELWLLEEDKTQAIVNLVYTTTQPNRSELAALAESVITYWGAHEVEPKGILVASTWADKHPQDRKDEDYPETMNEFAKRKNLCLLTTAQLLSIYRDLTVNETDPKEIREIILTTSGRITGFTFESSTMSNSKGKTAAVK